jgi:hypothetical protein
MRNGRRIAGPTLAAIRESCRDELQALPDSLRELSEPGADYPVQISGGLRLLAASLDADTS